VRILHDEVPEIPLVLVPRYFTYNQKIRGFETDTDGRFNTTTTGFRGYGSRAKRRQRERTVVEGERGFFEIRRYF
jgi:hypothetical protein